MIDIPKRVKRELEMHNLDFKDSVLIYESDEENRAFSIVYELIKIFRSNFDAPTKKEHFIMFSEKYKKEVPNLSKVDLTKICKSTITLAELYNELLKTLFESLFACKD